MQCTNHFRQRFLLTPLQDILVLQIYYISVCVLCVHLCLVHKKVKVFHSLKHKLQFPEGGDVTPNDHV